MTIPVASVTRKAGFTLLEALVVLAVTGLTLGLVFSVTSRSAVTAYRLGERAQGVAERQVSTTAYRAIISSFVIPPLTTRAGAEGGLEADAMDTSFLGEARQVSGEWLADRGSPCGPVGTYGRLTLALVTTEDGDGTALTCQLDDAEPVRLLVVRFRDAQFQYSEDAVEWQPSWLIEAGQPVELQIDPNLPSRQVYVRVVAEDGSSDLLELASTGHPRAN